MNLTSANQNKLYVINKNLLNVINLYENKKMPNKILLSGKKGIGKCTLAYHIINYILSADENDKYDLINYTINKNNKSYKLILNKTSPNFNLIDVNKDKKSIEIDQIRDLILSLNKSSFNQKPRFILIDNIENLNLKSSNALLKVLEEPNKNIYFILINNNKFVLPTIKSRCLNFNIFLTNSESIEVTNNIIGDDIFNYFDKDFLCYYFTPGKIYDLFLFSKEIGADLKKTNLKEFLKLIIKGEHFKKQSLLNNIIYDLIELFLRNNIYLIDNDLYHDFLNKINNTKKFNLDLESLLIEFEAKILNG